MTDYPSEVELFEQAERLASELKALLRHSSLGWEDKWSHMWFRMSPEDYAEREYAKSGLGSLKITEVYAVTSIMAGRIADGLFFIIATLHIGAMDHSWH